MNAGICQFCKLRMDDKQDLLRNDVTGSVAHAGCVRSAGTERVCPPGEKHAEGCELSDEKGKAP